MIQTVEAIVDEQGQVRLLAPVHLPVARRALVTILEEAPAINIPETALLSEPALAEDWDRPEEDAANLIDRLLETPLRVPGFEPLSRSEIYARGSTICRFGTA